MAYIATKNWIAIAADAGIYGQHDFDAVREMVEGAVGPWANNEYYEMHVDGLTRQLAK